MDYNTRVARQRRLTILRFLSDIAGYTSNGDLLYDVCNRLGVTSTRDQIAGEIAWLREQGMVTAEDHEGFIVVTATARGLDIAAGRALHDGVDRPRPGA